VLDTPAPGRPAIGPLEFVAPTAAPAPPASPTAAPAAEAAEPDLFDGPPLVGAAISAEDLDPVVTAERTATPTLPRLREYRPADGD
jgi:hypothetical protein